MFLKIKTKILKFLKDKRTREDAFTLIELLIVIALIGLLASAVSIAINPGKRVALANDAVRKQNFGGLANALLVYYVERGFYPYVGDDLMADSTEGPDWIPGLRPDYLKTLPKDPKQAGLFSNLAQSIQRVIQETKHFGPQLVSAATLSTHYFGSYITTGALGFEANLNPSKYNLAYAAGYSLAQQWAKLEAQDDTFNWTYLDSKLQELKNAGKKAYIRIHAGPSSPDWLRTQKGVKTVCWNQSGAPLNPAWNCFPWMTDSVYQSERKEMLQAIYNHYKGSALESTISYVLISPPNHIKAEEFVRVQSPNSTIYLNTNDASGVAIGIYCVSSYFFSSPCPEDQIKALPTSTFTAQGYSYNSLIEQFRNSIIDTADAMPTWYLMVMHGSYEQSPQDLVQNSYNTILNNNLVGRTMIGFTWLGRNPTTAGDQAIWDDVKANFFGSPTGEGMVGWEYYHDVIDSEIYEEWCKHGAPLRSKALHSGKFPNSELDQIFNNPDCGLASPSPSSSPVSSATPSPVVSSSPSTEPLPTPSSFKYLYTVTADLQSFTLWASLEILDDPEIYNKPGAKCPRVPPLNEYNFCVGI